jgi:hypothetical protein
MTSDRPTRIFVSYAHKDQVWRNALFKQSFDTPAGIHSAWTDDRIEPGSLWNDKIDQELQQATVAVLLVSKYFLQSVYISRKELPKLLRKRLSDGLKLLWIPIGNVPSIHGELAKIQAVYALSKPLAARPNDKAVQDVRYQIQAAIDPIGVPLMRDLAERYDPFVLIGRTDTAMVYKSLDRRLQRTVAIKTLIDTHNIDHFHFAARDAALVADQPNFVKLYDAELTGRWPYCVMQYIEGQSLRRWIEADNRRPLAVVIRILSQVTKALIAAHGLGEGYGNLRPSNIVLAKNNEPFIQPMGRRINDYRGRKLLDELEHRSTDSEEIAYLAPEQFDDAIETVSGELTDQYMLGLLAFELITGTLPPTIGGKPSSAASLTDIRRHGSAAFSELPLVSALRPDCSEVMVKIIQRMTRRQPVERYRSLKELLVDVRGQEDVVLARVRESYARCLNEQAARGMSFFEATYKAFFARRSDAQPLFEHLGPRQYEILENALVGLFSFYEQERARTPNEPNVLSQVARKHDRHHLRIGLDFYAPFAESIVDTACGSTAASVEFVFDPKCRDHAGGARDIRAAWRDVLTPGVEYMKGKY